MLVPMTQSHIRQAQQNKTYVYIPAEYRKAFGITVETKVNIGRVGDSLVITFPGD